MIQGPSINESSDFQFMYLLMLASMEAIGRSKYLMVYLRRQWNTQPPWTINVFGCW